MIKIRINIEVCRYYSNEMHIFLNMQTEPQRSISSEASLLFAPLFHALSKS